MPGGVPAGRVPLPVERPAERRAAALPEEVLREAQLGDRGVALEHLRTHGARGAVTRVNALK